MNFIQIKEAFKNNLLVSTNDIKKRFPEFDSKSLVRWQKKEYLIKIRNTYYAWSNQELSQSDLWRISNLIYHPSYISLESVLSYFQIIPEFVNSITAVSTQKTDRFKTPLGFMNYKHIKPNLFFGYTLWSHKNGAICVASLEKAILDFLYLNSSIKSVQDFESYRWNKMSLKQLNFKLLNSYLIEFNSKALLKRIDLLKYYCND